MKSGEGPAHIRTITRRPTRLYVVGDLHGCVREFAILLDTLLGQENLTADDLVLFIGDYVDRGPDSKAVVSMLLELRRRFPGTVFLRGNHEAMLLDYLSGDPSARELYLYNGGDTTLASYGLDRNAPPREVLKAIPREHLQFFEESEHGVLLAEFLFVHAGIHPYMAVNEQRLEDVLWIRNEFIMSIHELGKTVVFGHTPFHEVFFNLPYKIGIDTGLVYGNRLTCIELVDGKLFQVAKDGNSVEIVQLAGGEEG